MTWKSIKWFIMEERQYKCGTCHNVLTWGTNVKKHLTVHAQQHCVSSWNFKLWNLWDILQACWRNEYTFTSVRMVKLCLNKKSIWRSIFPPSWRNCVACIFCEKYSYKEILRSILLFIMEQSCWHVGPVI